MCISTKIVLIYFKHLFFCREPGKFDSFIKLERNLPNLPVSSFEKFLFGVNSLTFKLLYLAS